MIFFQKAYYFIKFLKLLYFTFKTAFLCLSITFCLQFLYLFSVKSWIQSPTALLFFFFRLHHHNFFSISNVLVSFLKDILYDRFRHLVFYVQLEILDMRCLCILLMIIKNIRVVHMRLLVENV